MGEWVRWIGDGMGRLIWVCDDCNLSGPGETEDGIQAGYAHKCAAGVRHQPAQKEHE
jgi:hypothetical protein